VLAVVHFPKVILMSLTDLSYEFLQ
jgi:hypothetical protein